MQTDGPPETPPEIVDNSQDTKTPSFKDHLPRDPEVACGNTAAHTSAASIEDDYSPTAAGPRWPTTGQCPLSFWIPRFVWAAAQRTAQASIPIRCLLRRAGKYLLFPAIVLGTLSAVFPAYLPGLWETMEWRLMAVFFRASSPSPPSFPPFTPSPLSSSSSSLEGYAGTPLGSLETSAYRPLRTLTQTSVDEFMNRQTYLLIVNIKTAVERDFPMVTTSTLNELWLNTDDVAKYPSRSYVVVVPATSSGTFSRLYRSVANVVSFCGPEGKSTPTSLPVSQALVAFLSRTARATGRRS
ncbi:hypothetical protein CH63R_14589 [Colletotrichum higginsianum IMI 349063]|uniref:Uncharacterized protein n=1 Tax=Colletotrichum higginsianum (strain IMI 349063) TaxID=759273 RepID=A0A1B7XQI3_COLHI|nr:hypothetical protein CH63R_14589 [Colletotrichum higginsianum IMI 349063]OBR02017.1 hypothetical protein CH63R_14589 [Colletotrichum higginsianum IMI 349063]